MSNHLIPTLIKLIKLKLPLNS